MKQINELKIGDKFKKTTVVTEEMINGFAKYTGDKNPVHIDEQFASNTIFKKRIAHGFLVGSFISAVLGNDFPGNGTIYLSQSLMFRAPVFINDKVTVKVEVLDFPKPERVLLKTTCVNQDGKVVIDGEAFIIPPKGVVLNNG
jgi:3-hydroxybutyryl-CoA dehydratase